MSDLILAGGPVSQLWLAGNLVQEVRLGVQLIWPPVATSYWGDWVAQTYGFEADIYPSWWAS